MSNSILGDLKMYIRYRVTSICDFVVKLLLNFVSLSLLVVAAVVIVAVVTDVVVTVVVDVE